MKILESLPDVASCLEARDREPHQAGGPGRMRTRGTNSGWVDGAGRRHTAFGEEDHMAWKRYSMFLCCANCVTGGLDRFGGVF